MNTTQTAAVSGDPPIDWFIAKSFGTAVDPEPKCSWNWNSGNVWVGDFPWDGTARPIGNPPMIVGPQIIPPTNIPIWPSPSYYPTVPDVVPYPYPEQPTFQQWLHTNAPAPSPWRVVIDTACTTLMLSIDMPGVRVEDIEMSTYDAKLTVTATRKDTKQVVTHSHDVGTNWDASSGEATLENGVLTVTFKKPKHFEKCSIVVTQK